MAWNIALVGCGNVGAALLETLHEKKDWLKKRYGFDFQVVMITDLIKGTIVDPGGIDLAKALADIRETGKFTRFTPPGGTFPEWLDRSGATMLAEATPTDLKTGEPGLTHIREALSRGIHVTTTNKGPIALAYDELTAIAEKKNACLRYEGVVMSGTPILFLGQEGLRGCAFQKLEGIVNGTTNYMLTRMGAGLDYASALKEAQEKGYAEANPEGDVEGWDAAVKVSLLARLLFGAVLPVDQITREGITKITSADIEKAKSEGKRIKLIAGIDTTVGGVTGFVRPQAVAATHPLASIDGATNAVCLTTDLLGPVTLIGPGAGRRETAQALLVDLLAIAQKKG